MHAAAFNPRWRTAKGLIKKLDKFSVLVSSAARYIKLRFQWVYKKSLIYATEIKIKISSVIYAEGFTVLP